MMLQGRKKSCCEDYSRLVAKSEEFPESVEPKRRKRIGLHLTYAAGMALCVGALTVECLRAADGNALSWIYVVEWPILGSMGTYLWWKLLHEDGTFAAKSSRRDLRAALEAASKSSALFSDQSISER